MDRSQARRDGVVIALVACSMLIYEILLTRVCALRTAFHFSFLVISAGLLGIGAAGTALYLLRHRIAGEETRWLARLTSWYALSLPVVYAFLVLWPVPAHVLVTDLGQLAQFLVVGLMAALPFVFVGGAIGLILSVRATRVHPYYALDMVGASLGCLVTPPLLWWAGAGGTLATSFAVALSAALVAARTSTRIALPAVAVALALVPHLDGWIPVPSKNRIQITKDITIETADNLVESRWSAISRIDVVAIPERWRDMFMKGRNAPAEHREEQSYVMQDGSAGTFFHDFTGSPEGLVGIERSLYSTASRILQPDSVFIIGAGGATDLWAAHHAGATRVKGIELNRQIMDLLTGRFADWSRDLLESPGVEIVHGEGRRALITEPDEWDLFQMSAIDTWTALVSGAYVLAENYLYTLDAVEDMFGILAPNGALQITRFSGEVEHLRLLAMIERAYRQHGSGDFAGSVACLQAREFMSTVCKRTPFTDEEIARFDSFIAESGLDVVYHPRERLGGVIEAFIRSREKDRIVAEATANITPVTDDKPYFFNFARWNDWSSAWRTIDTPQVVTQGNPLFLFGQLGLSLVAGLAFIVAPLVVRQRRTCGRGLSAVGLPGLALFSAIGFGFIAIEIALMQKLVLLLGHPLYSITVSLFGVLLFTGLSTLFFERFFAAPTRLIWIVPVVISAALLALASVGADVIHWAMPLSLVARCAVALAILLPIGLSLGIPFAHGVRLLERRDASLVPWAWATNATATVVGSIASVIVSMNFGFNAVLAVGALAYWIAAIGARALGRDASA